MLITLKLLTTASFSKCQIIVLTKTFVPYKQFDWHYSQDHRILRKIWNCNTCIKRFDKTIVITVIYFLWIFWCTLRLRNAHVYVGHIGLYNVKSRSRSNSLHLRNSLVMSNLTLTLRSRLYSFLYPVAPYCSQRDTWNNANILDEESISNVKFDHEPLDLGHLQHHPVAPYWNNVL